MEFSAKRGPTSDHKSYRSPFVESDDASAISEEPALAHDGVPGEAMPGRLQQLGTRPLSLEHTQSSTCSRSPQSLPSHSRAMHHPPEEPAEAEIEVLLQPENRPISELAMEIEATCADLEMVDAKCVDIGEQSSAATQEQDLSEKTYLNDLRQSMIAFHRRMQDGLSDSAMEIIDCTTCMLVYGMIKGKEEASDSKSGSNNVAVVRDALGGDSQKPRRLKPSPTRKYLPMMLQGKAIGAQHDTGVEGSNFMTSKLAEDLKLHVRTKESDRKSFLMGTGKVRRAIGRVRASCAFAKESGTKMKCWFYVLPKLASPLIMGSQFLRDTKTMSHFTHRLEDQFPCTPFAPMVNLISSTQQAKRRLVAFIGDRQTYINADSGSHLDLMSSAYIKKCGYELDRRRECRKRVQLADATAAETIGQVKAELTLHDGSTYLKTFDVLPGLTSEVLIGEDTLAELKIFTEHESSFIDVLGGERHFELSILSYLGCLNGFLVRKLNLSNRRSQAEYQRELSLDLSPVFGADVNLLVSLAKQQDDKAMEALHEQDLDAERRQREKKKLEASGAVLKRRKTA